MRSARLRIGWLPSWPLPSNSRNFRAGDARSHVFDPLHLPSFVNPWPPFLINVMLTIASFTLGYFQAPISWSLYVLYGRGVHGTTTPYALADHRRHVHRAGAVSCGSSGTSCPIGDGEMTATSTKAR